MAMKKSYGDLQKQLEKLLAQQKQMEQDAADAFVKAIMGSNARKQLAALSATDLQAVAKFIVTNMDSVIRRVQADRTAKEVAKQQVTAQPQASMPIPPIGTHG